eukprot:8948048-Heterocapsa_arctica.AAC.1
MRDMMKARCETIKWKDPRNDTEHELWVKARSGGERAISSALGAAWDDMKVQTKNHMRLEGKEANMWNDYNKRRFCVQTENDMWVMITIRFDGK